MAAIAASSRRNCQKAISGGADRREPVGQSRATPQEPVGQSRAAPQGPQSHPAPPAGGGLWFTAPAQANYSLLPTRDAEETDEQPPAPEVSRGSGRRNSLGTNDGAPDWYGRFSEKGMVILERMEVQMVSALVIILNALAIGLETDYRDWPGWEVVENSFLVFFTTELVLRIAIITPKKYFAWARNTDFVWNMFDLVIVSLGLMDFTATIVAPDAGGMGFATVFRIIRLARILRIFRIIKFLKQLYLLAYGFVEAALAIFWVTILMTFVLYVCGIMLARVYGHVSVEDPDHQFLASHFGSVPGSMLTLFELMSSPDLASYSDVLANRPSLLPFLVGFIIFGSFGMIALLTGVISESMFEKNKAKMEEERLEREQKRTKFLRECGELFDSVDADRSGSISSEELRGHLDDVAQLLDNYGMSFSPSELHLMFDALDSDASGSVERTEFENGVMQMCEDIRPMSIMELHNSIRKCQVRVEDCNKQLGSKFGQLDSRIEGLSKTVGLIYTVTVETRDRTAREPPTVTIPPAEVEKVASAREGSQPSVSSPPYGASAEAREQPLVLQSQEAVCEAAEEATCGNQAVAPGCCADGGQPAAHEKEVKAESSRSRACGQSVRECDGHSVDVPAQTSAVLLDFRSRLEELVRQVQVEVQHAEAANSRMGELLALQAEHTARLNSYSSALSKASALASWGDSKEAEPLLEESFKDVHVLREAEPAPVQPTAGSIVGDLLQEVQVVEVHVAAGSWGEEPSQEASTEAAQAPEAAG